MSNGTINKGSLIKGNGGSGGGGGSSKQVTLLSITTAPTGTFEKGSKYYNSTTRLIYTATADDVWGTDGETPKFNTIYIYDNNGTTEYYQWDGDNLVETDLEKYQLKSNITDSFSSSSQVTYPSSKALKDGLETAKPNLFDIKLLSQAVVDNEGKTDKGWACLSHTTRKDISKDDVPTVFEDIKSKYDNCDRGTLPITDLTNMSVPLLYDDGYYYFLDKSDYKTLKKSSNLDLSSPITVCDLSSYVNTGRPSCYLLKGNNTYAIYSYKSGKQLFIFNNDWTLKYTINAPNSSWVSEDLVKYIDGYYYILSDRKILMRVSESTGESETLATDIPAPAYTGSGSFCGDMIKVGNYIFYNYWVRNNSSCICRVDITDGSYISKAFTLYRGNYSTLMYENNTLFFFCNYTTTHYKYVSTDLGENWTENTINGISNEGEAQSIQKKDNTYYLALDTGIYTSTDLENFTLFMYDGVALSHWKAFFCNENSDIILITGLEAGNVFDCNYSYTGLVKTKYSETINGTTIYYYKYNDWKICIAGENGTNDVNLDTVYNYLGYLNYWRLDLASGSETISLPRNSNLWTFMYVGDDYEDSNLPSGEYSAVALKSELPKNLSFTNVSASNWVADNTYADYGYKCELSCSGVTANMFAQVIFAPTEADSGNYATVCDTDTNTVTIYSKVNDSITIPTIVVMGV